MDQYVSFTQGLFHELIKLGEKLANVFGFHVKEGVDDVADGRFEGYVIHAYSSCDDWMAAVLPVLIAYSWMKVKSKAAWMSPRKMEVLVVGWVYTL